MIVDTKSFDTISVHYKYIFVSAHLGVYFPLRSSSDVISVDEIKQMPQVLWS
jgi:hypothetical protein